MYGEAIRSSGKRIAAAFNSLRNNSSREAEYRIFKSTFLTEFPLDNPGGRVTGMEGRRGELFSRNCCYFYVAGEGFGGTCDWLIGRGFSLFVIKGFGYAPQA